MKQLSSGLLSDSILQKNLTPIAVLATARTSPRKAQQLAHWMVSPLACRSACTVPISSLLFNISRLNATNQHTTRHTDWWTTSAYRYRFLWAVGRLHHRRVRQFLAQTIQVELVPLRYPSLFAAIPHEFPVGEILMQIIVCREYLRAFECHWCWDVDRLAHPVEADYRSQDTNHCCLPCWTSI